MVSFGRYPSDFEKLHFVGCITPLRCIMLSLLSVCQFNGVVRLLENSFLDKHHRCTILWFVFRLVPEIAQYGPYYLSLNVFTASEGSNFYISVDIS